MLRVLVILLMLASRVAWAGVYGDGVGAGVVLYPVVTGDGVTPLVYGDGVEGGAAVPWVNEYSTASDGINDGVATGLANAVNDITNAISAFCWVKMDGSNANGDRIFCRTEANAPARAWNMTLFNGLLNVVISKDGGTSENKNYVGSITITNDAWHLVGFTFTNDTLKLYTDGVEDVAINKVKDKSVPYLYDGQVRVTIGYEVDGGTPVKFLQAEVDEAAIWDIELTASSIADIYNSGSATDLSVDDNAGNLALWWRMGDDDTHPTLTDHAGTNNATMYNMSQTNFVQDVPTP